ncbi:MAG: 1-phosphofructokinase family hexose kinase [Lachnospira sp.]|nr:1-phosphofructokinase family hexose kinase [Lachnospira sp.]
MIYTLTMNPSLDYYMWVDELQIGKTNRSDKESILLGGKGLNVSKTLYELGVDSTAICVVAGFVGDEIEKRLKNEGYLSYIIKVQGDSRINVKLKSDVESEINASGPLLNEDNLNDILKIFWNLNKDDIVVLSGSLLKNVPVDFYKKIVDIARKKGAKAVIDTSGAPLKEAIGAGVFLVKPNLLELSQIFKVDIKGLSEVKEYARKLLSMGAENVLVSMGDKGSIFVNENMSIYKEAIKCKPNNTVGAGDAMVAGFIKGYIEREDFEYAMEVATECANKVVKEIWIKD